MDHAMVSEERAGNIAKRRLLVNASGPENSNWILLFFWGKWPEFVRSEKLLNESSPNFSNFRPEFCPEFCSEFSPNSSRSFRASFWRSQKKIHRKFPPFFNAKFPVNFEEQTHKSFRESGQSKNSEKGHLYESPPDRYVPSSFRVCRKHDQRQSLASTASVRSVGEGIALSSWSPRKCLYPLFACPVFKPARISEPSPYPELSGDPNPQERKRHIT